MTRSETARLNRNRESTPAAAALHAGRRLALLSMAVSGGLALANVAAGLWAGSTAVAAAGAEFTCDIFASAVVFIGMQIAVKPADENHPYGHGRFETLAGLLVGIGILLGGIGICYHSLQQLTAAHAPPAAYSMLPLAVALLAKAGLSTTKFRLGRAIDSSSLLADAWNDAVDTVSASAALVAVGLTIYNPARFLAADHYGGFLVGLIVVATGMWVARDAALQLADTMPNQELIRQIRTAASAVPGVLAVEKCYARKTGLQYHVDLHIVVDSAISVAEAHAIAGHVRSHLRQQVAAVSDALVHVEPSP